MSKSSFVLYLTYVLCIFDKKSFLRDFYLTFEQALIVNQQIIYIYILNCEFK